MCHGAAAFAVLRNRMTNEGLLLERQKFLLSFIWNTYGIGHGDQAGIDFYLKLVVTPCCCITWLARECIGFDYLFSRDAPER